MAINTARPPLYCLEPDPITTRLATKADHHCYTGKSWWFRNMVCDVPASKVANMETIAARGNVSSHRCCVLVDDRRENIEAVDAAGFTGFNVDYKNAAIALLVAVRLAGGWDAYVRYPRKRLLALRVLCERDRAKTEDDLLLRLFPWHPPVQDDVVDEPPSPRARTPQAAQLRKKK